MHAGASTSVAKGMVSIEFPEPPSANKAEAARLLGKGVQRSRQDEYRKAAGICLMHAAFQRIHAGTDVGVDFSRIWPAAQMMHAASKP